MTSCSCIYVGDFDSPSFYSREMRKANREHKCSECSRPIAPGEQYENARGKWNEEFAVYKTCRDCLSVRDEFFCDGYPHQGIWEAVTEHLHYCDGHISAASIAELTPAARDKVCDMIEEIWEDDCEPLPNS